MGFDAEKSKRGTYQDEYEWALANPDDVDGRNLLSVAQMYARHQDHATLGVIQGICDNIRAKMTNAAKR